MELHPVSTSRSVNLVSRLIISRFNGGPRICVGQNFALTEMAYVVARMLQRYDRLEYRGDWDKQFHKVEIVGTPGHGIPVAMWEAKDFEKS